MKLLTHPLYPIIRKGGEKPTVDLQDKIYRGTQARGFHDKAYRDAPAGRLYNKIYRDAQARGFYDMVYRDAPAGRLYNKTEN